MIDTRRVNCLCCGKRFVVVAKPSDPAPPLCARCNGKPLPIHQTWYSATYFAALAAGS